MSREVINDAPSDWGPSGPGSAPVVAVDVSEVSDAAVAQPAVYRQDDALVADLASPDGAPDGAPAAGPAVGVEVSEAVVTSAAERAAGQGLQRPVAVWVLGVAAGVALLLGVVAGTAQGRGGERYDRLQATRILVYPEGVTNIEMGKQRVQTDLVGMSTGGAVTVTELRTAFGTIPLRPPVTLTSNGMTRFPIDVLADCSSFETFRQSGLPTDFTGTALVRDRPDDTRTRSVVLQYSPELWTTMLYVPCSSPDEVVNTDETGTGAGTTGSAAPTALLFTRMAVRDDGALTVDATAQNVPAQTVVDVNLPDRLVGTTPGHFEITKLNLPVSVAQDGEQLRGTVILTYHCRTGDQGLPAPEEILRPDVTGPDGRPADAAGIDVQNWDANAAAQSVRIALRTAGCPAAT